MKIEVIDNHSVAVDLLTKGPILDAGARGFRFAKWFSERYHETYCCDPSPDLEVPNFVAHFDRVALGARDWPLKVTLHNHGDPEGWYAGPECYREVGPRVPTWNLHVNWGWTETNPWDVVKLNIEGAEYDVLSDWPGPIARQIVVSFHEHTARARGDAAIRKIVEHLSRWYVPVRHVKDARYCAGENWWDSLFVLKELL